MTKQRRGPTFRGTVRTIIYQGKERILVELCRELQMNQRTVRSRLERGLEPEQALHRPLRPYPLDVTRRKCLQTPQIAPQDPARSPLIQDAIDLFVDLRGILESLDATPRRLRLLAGVRRWLRSAGWR